MPVTTFAAPILPGRTETWKKAVSEISGARKAEYEDSRRRMGVTREIASLQSTPQGDFVVVCIEADDPATVMSRYLASDAPFDRWFTETVLTGVHGIESAPPPNETFVDWRA